MNINVGKILKTATETVKGVVELATSAEVLAGVDTERAVTPASFKAALVSPSMTGSATLNGMTNNTVSLSGIVTTLELEVGDVIRIQYSGYAKLHSVESITNNNLIIVNYEHAGNRGNGSLKLPNTTASVTVTRIAKWFNAPIGLGQAWVSVMSYRAFTTIYINTTGRPIMVNIDTSTSSAVSTGSSDGSITWVTLSTDAAYGVAYIVPSGHLYRQGKASSGTLQSWVEVR